MTATNVSRARQLVVWLARTWGVRVEVPSRPGEGDAKVDCDSAVA